jgi:glycerophosphoryl diester phosphodiesterase
MKTQFIAIALAFTAAVSASAQLTLANTALPSAAAAPYPAAMATADLVFIAHRGEYMALADGTEGANRKGYVDAPEGTLPTFERVRDRNVNGVKLDVQYTADKVVVISHDLTLLRTTGQDLTLSKTAYADLKAAPFKTIGAFANERIVTLDEALAVVKECPRFYLDFKTYSPEMMEDVFAHFAKHGVPRDHIMVATFSRKALEGVQTAHPDVRRVFHISYPKQEDGSYNLNGTRCADFAVVKAVMLLWKRELGLTGFNIPAHAAETTPAFVRELKAEGCWVTIWYGHSTDTADRFAATGIDGFVTGMPTALKTYLAGKAR